jgi:hypothetical protein
MIFLHFFSFYINALSHTEPFLPPIAYKNEKNVLISNYLSFNRMSLILVVYFVMVENPQGRIDFYFIVFVLCTANSEC